MNILFLHIMNYIDLFAGAGGLSEGFTKAGFNPIAHVESDKAACFTLMTRLAYYYLSSKNQLDIYNSYLKGEISRDYLYGLLPESISKSVINKYISSDNNIDIFAQIDKLLGENEVDLIIGGLPEIIQQKTSHPIQSEQHHTDIHPSETELKIPFPCHHPCQQ